MIARIEHAAREIETSGPTGCGPPLHLRSARITKSQQLGHFVERLPGRVINRPAEDAILVHTADFHEQRMTAAHDQRHIRLDLKIPAEEGRKQVAFKVIDRQVRPAGAEREAFCDRGPDHQ